MSTTLTKIGNSQGVRIPKSIIKQAKLEDAEIEFEITKDGLLLKPIKKVSRKNWEVSIKETFKKSSDTKDEGLLEDFLNHEHDIDWEW